MPTKPTMTLDRVLSRFGLASRNAAREAIMAGRMKVNGRIVRDPDVWVSPGRDTFHLDGQRLKPRANATAFLQAQRRDYQPWRPRRPRDDLQIPRRREPVGWVPVGRLDKDTSGLLLLTTDTEFAGFHHQPGVGVPRLTW